MVPEQYRSKVKSLWINIAHGVRNTAAGLRYVLYVFGTALEDPSKLSQSHPGISCSIWRRTSRRCFKRCIYQWCIARENGDVYIYYASSDTRMHVATTTIDKLEDYLFNTPEDPHRSPGLRKAEM